MSRTDTDVVRELLRATDAKDWPRVLGLISEDSFARTSSGKVYIGRKGLSNWLKDTSASTIARWFEAVEVRALGDGFVLVVGAEHRDPVRGASEATPGAWVYHVRNGVVTATLYFRTEQEAIASLSGPGREQAAAEVVTRAFDAFNHDNYVELLAILSDEIRFSSATIDPGVEHRGLDAFAHRSAAIQEAFDEMLVDLRSVEDLGGGFCLALAEVVTSEGGERSRRPAAWLARVVEGRITELLAYESPENARLEAAVRVAEADG